MTRVLLLAALAVLVACGYETTGPVAASRPNPILADSTTTTLRVFDGGATPREIVSVEQNTGKVTLGPGVTAEDAIRRMAQIWAQTSREQGETCRKENEDVLKEAKEAMRGWKETEQLLNQCLHPSTLHNTTWKARRAAG